MKKGIKVLLVLSVLLLVGCEEKTKSVSLNDEKVKKVIENFMLDEHGVNGENPEESAIYSMTEYANEKLDENVMYNLVFKKAKIFSKDDTKCDEEKFSNEEEDYFYTCEYIEYAKTNEIYNSLFGKELPKENIKAGLYILIYDKDADVYRICSISAGGGSDYIDATTLSKVEEKGDYLYIYEKVAFLSSIFSTDAENEGELIGYNITYPKNIDNPKRVSDEGTIAKTKEKYLDTFETYKWTFKKDSKDNYVFESLEYVK